MSQILSRAFLTAVRNEIVPFCCPCLKSHALAKNALASTTHNFIIFGNLFSSNKRDEATAASVFTTTSILGTIRSIRQDYYLKPPIRSLQQSIHRFLSESLNLQQTKGTN